MNKLDKEQKAINAVNNLQESIYNNRGTELRYNVKSKFWDVIDEFGLVHLISNSRKIDVANQLSLFDLGEHCLYI